MKKTLLVFLLFTPIAQAAALDLSHAVIVAEIGENRAQDKAVEMLVDEVEKRTGIRLPTAEKWPPPDRPVIAIGQSESKLLQKLPFNPLAEWLEDRETPAPEGYRIGSIAQNGAVGLVVVAGSDLRGVLFGVGRLLRLLSMSEGQIEISGQIREISAPAYAMRGHQIGYRSKSNTYDAWSLPRWEQYIRDLVVFGTNAIELIPPLSGDKDTSPHFPLPTKEMLVQLSRLLDDYDLDTWLWYPAHFEDYSDPATVRLALQESEEIFSRMQRLDGVFVPGGDPGHTRPIHLLAFLEKQAEVLRRHHPDAGMWVSPQHFGAEKLEEFFELLREEPEWLRGVVYGPHVRVSVKELRDKTPSRYDLRLYPDIAHMRQCQYPIQDWDMAFALTEGRESINPRPQAYKRIMDLHALDSVGFITYSDGVNDDVNKFIYSSLGWNPNASAYEILKEYSRYFIGEDYEDDFSQGLMALESNWNGPLLQNEEVYTTLKQFQSMERSAPAAVRSNWRFQMALYRAYYDAYLRSRLIHETSLEEFAFDALGKAERGNSMKALAAAEVILDRVESEPVSTDWRDRVFALADDLFHSIGMQLSIEKYQATEIHRGANLDSIDLPLNNRLWLKRRFAEIGILSEEERLAGIDELLNHTNPGSGGFYDELGNLTRQPHLLRGAGVENDPMLLRSSLAGFGEREAEFIDYPIYWWRYAETKYDTPVQMRYTDLDPEAQYLLQVVYAGDSPDKNIRLTANDQFEIHPLIEKPVPFRRLEFAIPREATTGGVLTLSWRRQSGLGGNGRGCQVAEVWLRKVKIPGPGDG